MEQINFAQEQKGEELKMKLENFFRSHSSELLAEACLSSK